jgi:protein-disulfide isomerase-like protein with CxxC motif
MVQKAIRSARHTRPAKDGATRSLVVRMGSPAFPGFVINPDSAMMAALSSGDMATRTMARANFTVEAVRP